jgi:hypothetical protein
MKIAIPTSDEINIAENLSNSIGYLVFTVQFGEIVAEEFRPISWSDLLVDTGKSIPNIEDCSVLIQRANGHGERVPAGSGKQVVITNESIITNIIVRYLNTSLVRESNLSCCP